jgi:coatomer protein complex subunit epsilon
VTDTHDRSLYLIVQIYLSISRADLAKKEFALAKTNIPTVTDSLLFALTEAAIGLATGGAPLVSAYHIYDEQVSAPGSSQNANIIASKGVAELLRGHVTEALGSFDEALSVYPLCADALVGRAVAKQLTAKQAEADEAFECVRFSWLSVLFDVLTMIHMPSALKNALPSHPYIRDIDAKSALFDQLKGQYAANA